jgi:hypothetical protein
MKRCVAVGVFALAALAVAGVSADEALKSGPQVGKRLTPFSPLNINGSAAGQKVCQV